jgi:hypothetical protein
MNTKQLALVTFEQAKRLNALGFNWECTDMYEGGTLTNNVGLFNYNSQFWTYSAPPVALSLKWIRDEKNIHCGVTVGTRNKIFASYCYDEILVKLTDYNTYEAAESALLDQLLTILEKQK